MSSISAVNDYADVTEVPGLGATREQLSMLYTRYKWAVEFCEGKDVLEVACGAGLGLGYLAARARRIVGGDYTERLLRMAREHYRSRVPLVRLDAHMLPFRDRAFDVVILYEAIYYLTDPGRFLAECRRVLREPGIVLICTVNREWPDFNPSHLSTRYFAARELSDLLRQHGFDVKIYGAFPALKESARGHILSLLRRTAIALHLIPRTMKGKTVLKRLFYGKLTPIPPEVVDEMAPLEPLVLLPADTPVPIKSYKVLYALARLR
ncbi:putative S-adenosylmethionine-dependent methyltransferase [bacterium HR23]|nr:putative S-adenosylmethionine-dependent methyltransferase [bacterium HR23]